MCSGDSSLGDPVSLPFPKSVHSNKETKSVIKFSCSMPSLIIFLFVFISGLKCSSFFLSYDSLFDPKETRSTACVSGAI